MNTIATTSALQEWRSALGAAYVVTDAPSLRSANTATFDTHARALAILRPASRDEVQQCVRIANRHEVPLYPVSSGKNWGYGSSAPSQDAVLIDLRRLNRIIDFNEELAYVTIEPGVTQQQLFDFLRGKGSRLWMDATGASPECSIIGNTMDRGFGHTPMGDHAGNACGFEVVLPTGDCIQTGFARFEGSAVSGVGRWGLGPSLDGLFAQSNLGIVTRMSVWLMPEPEAFQAFFFLCKERDGLNDVIDALRPLRLNGTLRSVMHIGNDYKVVAATGQYPWEQMKGRTPLDLDTMRDLRRRQTIGSWNGSGALYGTKAQVRDARAQLRRALAGKVDRLQFVDDRLLGIMARFAGSFRLMTGWDISRTLKVIAPVYGLLKGVPTDSPLSSTYWRKKTAVPEKMDPDRDGCGLLWCSPVVPNTGEHAAAATSLATSIVLEHGFEPQISISLATERVLFCVTTISYDRSIEGEDARAFACYRDLAEQLLQRGYPPYRLNVSAMDLAESDSPYAGALNDIKNALDPNGILAPGRYVKGAAQEAKRQNWPVAK